MTSHVVVSVLASLTLLACFAGQLVRGQRGGGGGREELPECQSERGNFVFRNSNRTCHPRAVCADVFDTVRNWYGYQGRENCREHRVLHQCMCEGEDGSLSQCPINDPAHRLFASKNHQQYTCQPACTLPYCGNLRGRRGRTGRNTALSMIQRDPEFGYRNHYRMECRCPRHHVPVRRPGIHRAVEAYDSTYSFQTHNYVTLYRCRNVGRRERNMADPCLAVRQVPVV